MPETYHLSSLPVLSLQNGEKSLYGPTQEWYRTEWQRRAGCGPTAASSLIWYLSRTRGGGAALWNGDASNSEGFLTLMEEVWKHVTPGMMGLNRASMFTSGAMSYAKKRGVCFQTETLEIPPVICSLRPDKCEFTRFLLGAMENDRPVAFLNLSNGTLDNLYSWHWVVLVGFCPEKMTAMMYDAGAGTEIEIGKWLDTSSLGGALVTLDLKE